MTKKIIVTVGERTAAVGLLNAGHFSNSTLAVVLGDIKNLAMSEQDWKDANLVKSPTDEAIAALSPEQRATAQQTWKWNENEKTEKEVELEQGTVDVILEMIKDKSDKKEMTLADGALVSLQKKLNA